MTTILVNIHFIVAKINNYIKKNKHKQDFILIQDQIVIFRPAPLHYPSHPLHHQLSIIYIQ